MTIAPPQRHDVAKHGQSVPPQGKRRAVLPHQADGDSLERQAQPLREEHHFRVEGKTIQCQSGEYLARRPPAEGLQPALRVGDFSRDEPLDDLAEKPGGQRSREPAAGAMGGFRQIAGAEDDFALPRWTRS